MKNTYLILLFLLHTSCISAQVLNVDRQNSSDSVLHKNLYTIRLHFVSDKQRRNLLEANGDIEWDRFFNNNRVLICFAHADMAANGKNLLENNGYLQLRYRDNDTRPVAPDYYVQYQWNGIWGLQNRALIGCNARFKFWDDRSNDLYMSTGLFYEYERWNPALSAFTLPGDSSGIVYRNLIRLNLNAKTALRINEHIDVAGVTFIQFPIGVNYTQLVRSFFQPRWIMDITATFKVSKHLGITMKYAHNLDYFRALPIDLYFYEFNVGLMMQW
jgi:hypothetical protein